MEWPDPVNSVLEDITAMYSGTDFRSRCPFEAGFPGKDCLFKTLRQLQRRKIRNQGFRGCRGFGIESTDPF
jgi:hypothetical protein